MNRDQIAEESKELDPPQAAGDQRPEQMDEERRLDQRIRSVLRTGPEDYPPDQWRGLREHARLPLLYSGLFVAFRDHYAEGVGRRLERREVLYAAASLEQVQEHVAGLPEQEQQGVEITCVE
jgi:hypothetical protein